MISVGSVVQIYSGPPAFGELAQLGERLVCNQEVTGSIPVFSTSLREALASLAASAGEPASRDAEAVRRSRERSERLAEVDDRLTARPRAMRDLAEFFPAAIASSGGL